MQQLLGLAQRLRGWVLVQDDPDVSDAPLHAVDGLLVRSADTAGLHGVDLVDEAVCLIGQLTDNVIPLGEALVAPLAVGEGSREAAAADVASWARDPLHTDAVAAGFVTLLL